MSDRNIVDEDAEEGFDGVAEREGGRCGEGEYE